MKKRGKRSKVAWGLSACTKHLTWRHWEKREEFLIFYCGSYTMTTPTLFPSLVLFQGVFLQTESILIDSRNTFWVPTVCQALSLVLTDQRADLSRPCCQRCAL